MDTLIDSRDFPTEMQERTPPTQPEKKNWLGFLLIFLALGLIGFLVYKIFFTPKPTITPIDTVLEQKRAKVIEIRNSIPQATPEAREDILRSFLNTN